MHSNKKQLAGSQFHGANLELLNPQAGKPKALGVSGVSDFKGFSADYSNEGSNPLHLGAGVSVMALKPSTSSFLKVEDYSIYKKKGVNALKGGNLYSGASNPKSLKTFNKIQLR
tara:strand:+ start:2154 stop:2495 length:342 start_codon:yes stop_codon:yes gene_type:complete